MAKVTIPFGSGDSLSSGLASEKSRSSTALKGEFEILGQTRSICSKLAALESEKKSLVQEMRVLENKALRGWGGMSRRQVLAVVLFGIILTSAVVLVPPMFVGGLVNPLVGANLPLKTLDKQTALVSYLRQVQGLPDVYLAVHGYDHKCPIDGSTSYEFTCPTGQLPISEINRRIESGIAIFMKCGLEVDMYAFPGEDADARVLSVLANYTPTSSIDTKVPLKLINLTASSSLVDPILYYGFREYTWMWRNGVSDQQFQTAVSQLNSDKPSFLLVHVQDITNQTLQLIRDAVVQTHVEIVRLDDITFESQVQATQQVVDIVKQSSSILILSAIPASPNSGDADGYLDAMFTTFWVLSSTLFVFPIAVLIPWALIFKNRRKKPYAKWAPNYPSVSVILPAFNEEKNIGQSIERILGQHYRGSLDVIVVDDGSTDRTFEIAKSYADKYANVKAIRYEKNKGKSHALNTGFAEAKGEISVFSDTDSVLEPEAISRMISHFKDPEVGMVCGLVVIGNEKNLLQRLQQIEYIYSQTIIRFCQSSQKNVWVCPGSCAAVRTEIARKIPVTDRTLAEDADFTFSVLKEGWKVCQEPESMGYTDAPANLRKLVDQRKRWSYGTLQTMSHHKWAAREGNLWVLKSWLECFLSPLILLYLASFPLLWLYLGDRFPLFLLTYGMMPFVILGANIAIGLKLFNQGEKVKLALLVPIYVIYGFILNILSMCMFLAFLSRRGIHIRRGGRIIHAV